MWGTWTEVEPTVDSPQSTAKSRTGNGQRVTAPDEGQRLLQAKGRRNQLRDLRFVDGSVDGADDSAL